MSQPPLLEPENLAQPIPMTDALFLRLIGLYRQRLSPIKKWGCAKRIFDEVSGTPDAHSCSIHGDRLIRNFGMAKALPLMLQRRRECFAAGAKIRQAKELWTAGERLRSMAIFGLSPHMLGQIYGNTSTVHPCGYSDFEAMVTSWGGPPSPTLMATLVATGCCCAGGYFCCEADS